MGATPYIILLRRVLNLVLTLLGDQLAYQNPGYRTLARAFLLRRSSVKFAGNFVPRNRGVDRRVIH